MHIQYIYIYTHIIILYIHDFYRYVYMYGHFGGLGGSISWERLFVASLNESSKANGCGYGSMVQTF